MSCININDPRYQEILKEVDNLLIANQIYRQRYLKDGVDLTLSNEENLTSRELSPEAREVIKIARANFSEEEASLIENRLLTGEDSFGDISNFTCS
jgi:hypothetical protein